MTDESARAAAKILNNPSCAKRIIERHTAELRAENESLKSSYEEFKQMSKNVDQRNKEIAQKIIEEKSAEIEQLKKALTTNESFAEVVSDLHQQERDVQHLKIERLERELERATRILSLVRENSFRSSGLFNYQLPPSVMGDIEDFLKQLAEATEGERDDG